MRDFTDHRLAIAHHAEQALDVAVRASGSPVQWGAIAAAWPSVADVPCPYTSPQPWWWIFEPGLTAGRVVKEKRGSRVYYQLRSEVLLPLPLEPEFSAFRERLCLIAEKALRTAQRDAGTQVGWKQIKQFWPICDIAVPTDLGQSWVIALAPAVQAGRVIITKRGAFNFFKCADEDVPLPDCSIRSPRVVGSDVEVRLTQVQHALERAVTDATAMVGVQAIRASWANSGGGAPEYHIVRSDLTLLEERRLVRSERVSGHSYFAPSTLPDLTPPRFESDLRRVEEAVTRACARWRSAVPIEKVEGELERDPLLQPNGVTSIAVMLSNLRTWNRIRALDRSHTGSARLKYYSPPDGPHWVRSEIELPIDRRRRAIQDLWRRCGRQPFTTRCIRMFATSRPGYRLDGCPPYAWTLALHVLHRDGFLERLDAGDGWHCRWAIKCEWDRLDWQEREMKIRDVFGRDPEVSVTELPPVDAAIVSRSEDIRALVLAVKGNCPEKISDARTAQILAARPVSLRDLRESRTLRPHLRITRKGKLAHEMVGDAVRTTLRRKRKPLTTIGVAGKRRFVDVHRTEANMAYMRYLDALHVAKSHRHQIALNDFLEARGLAPGSVPIPLRVLESRADWLAHAATELAEHLRHACADPHVLLFEDELTDALEIAAALDRITEHSGGVPSRIDATSADPSWGRVVAITSMDAWNQLHDYVPWTLAHSGALASRMVTVRTVAARTVCNPNPANVRKRPAKHHIERVDFAMYTSWRCGGPALSAAARRAMHLAGQLRDPRPFVSALLDDDEAPAHDGLATVLGFFDEPGARRVLLRYINEHLDSGTGTVPGVECAVYGLARLPFGGCASVLHPEERDALVRVGRAGLDDHLRWMARRVLTSWDEDWDQDQLLWL